MKEKDRQLQSLGICQRLFYFIMNNLVARGLKHVNLGQNLAAQPADKISLEGPSTRVEMPLNSPTTTHHKEEETSAFLEHDQEVLKGDPGSEIIVELKHRNGIVHWMEVDKFGFSTNQDTEKHTSEAQLLETGDTTRTKAEVQADDSKHADVQPTFSGMRQRGPRKSSSIKIGAEKGDKMKKKYHNTEGENVHVETSKKAPVIHIRPHLIVSEPNINEKSDAFIRSKRAALKRTDTVIEPQAS